MITKFKHIREGSFETKWKNGALEKFSKFSFVGVANTFIDIGILSFLLWRFPTASSLQVAGYNLLAIGCGACNSFFWNKYWTFRKKQNSLSWEEIRAFILTAGIMAFLNTDCLYIVARLFPGIVTGLNVGAIVCKIVAITTTFFLSFFVMQIYVFRDRIQEQKVPSFLPESPYPYSLSVVLPAYNEEKNIHTTIYAALHVLPSLVQEYEIILVNDGSTDATGTVAQAIACTTPFLRVLTHEKNKGYGEALKTGFLAATKEYSFYMDSDGQFDIRDLARLLPELAEYDGVFGYRMHRQDPFLRKLNAWGWNLLVRFLFCLSIKDVDGAFKIFRTEFFQKADLQASGAMMPTEMIYKFARAGYTYTQVGVNHYPRTAGTSTGANIKVILKAFQELWYYAQQWSEKGV